MAITLTDNEFFSGLTNLALIMRLYATNTSDVADNFVNSFATDTLANGNQKFFTFSKLPTVSDYSDASSLLTVTKVDTNQEYIIVSEKKMIKSSFNEKILTQAFTSDSGMNEFTGYLLGQMESAKTDYIYDMIITDIFGKVFTGTKQNHTINTIDTSAITDFAQLNAAEIINQKRITIGIQDDLQNIQVFNDEYNGKIGYKQALKTDDMRMLFCNPYHNENIVNLYSSLLKSEYIEKSFEKPILQVIPSIKIPSGNTNVIGYLMHKYAYQFFYKFTFMGTFFDMSNLSINNFLHFWIGKGWLDNLPAVKLIANPS
jgi:hypothetical protein